MSREGIAETLKAKRKESNLNVDEVCKRLEEYDISLSKNTMYNYESGYRQPDADTLMALCEIYGIVDVLGIFGYKKSPATAEAAPGDDVFRIFDALNTMLVSAGLIQDGDDITEKQSEVLLAICRIIDATFKD